MKKSTLCTRGGEFAYLAPTLEVTAVEVEKGFAASGDWENSINGNGADGSLSWGDDNNQFE